MVVLHVGLIFVDGRDTPSLRTGLVHRWQAGYVLLLALGGSDCEALRDGWLAQPVNTLSSVAYVVAGAYVLRRGGPRVPALALATVGVGSVLYHGPMPPGAELVHDGSIIALAVTVPLAWRRRSLRWPPTAALIAGAAAIVVNVLTRTGAPLCRPESLLQGHAAWHVLTAIAIALWFAPRRGLRREDRSVHEQGVVHPLTIDAPPPHEPARGDLVKGEWMWLEPERIEDVPIPELSSLALAGADDGPAQLLAIGDKRSMLARAVLTDEPLEWDVVNLRRYGVNKRRGQFEGIAVAGEGRILLLSEDPPLVHVVDIAGDRVERIVLSPGRIPQLDDIFDESSSAGEGLLPLRAGRLIVAKEKRPALLVEFGPVGADAVAVASASFPGSAERLGQFDARLEALAGWKLGELDDVSDLAFAGSGLYVLSDRSRRVVMIDLPLDPGAERALIGVGWDLSVPGRADEPDGKPEGLVVTDDGQLIIGLDTETSHENLCWYRPPGIEDQAVGHTR